MIGGKTDASFLASAGDLRSSIKIAASSTPASTSFCPWFGKLIITWSEKVSEVPQVCW
ncbi:hypothetical protein GQ55_2G070700 [Panicum hallii var. hallii]|uniref:Uncharacterized protein n=1 Tax=Panicum hallii var. hallii TaxID=1504633 RepID=A0A2T7EMB1_9POAL|nr:hypothetical protein GQ55_2G070700 [Panicum hallii var. hallii]